MLTRIRDLPGVEAAGGTSFLPLEGWSTSEFRFDGREDVPVEELPSFEYDIATPGYFRAMGVRLISGRPVLDTDRADGAPVVVVNQALARRVWPDDNPIGKQVGVFKAGSVIWSEVVGVAADVRHHGVSAAPPKVYIPHRQLDWDYALIPMRIVVRAAAGDALALTPDIRGLVRQLDPDPPVLTAQSLASWSTYSTRARASIRCCYWSSRSAPSHFQALACTR